jgi:P-type Cu2+ transporter
MEDHHHSHHEHKAPDQHAGHHHHKREAVVNHPGARPVKETHPHDQHSLHDKHAGHHTANFLKRFWICLALTVPILFLSHMIQQWLGVDWRFPGDLYILLVLSSIIYFYGGWPFLDGMVRELKAKAPGMMTLVAVAISVAYLYSVAVVFGLEGMDFFWELSTLIDIMLLGHWLEMKSQTAASRALESLVALMPSIVHVEKNGGVIDISLQDLKKNDIAIIKPGEKMPADGIIIDGSSSINESMLTGESVPVKKGKDEKVIGGSINGDGSIKIMVTGTGTESYLSKVIGMVRSAQDAKSGTQNLADRVAKWLTIVSITVGVVTLIVWLTAGKELSFALERMVTVMVTSCPHALGVAIPLVVAISTTVSATHGLLIRNRTAFENARKLTTIIFDKTGTLTAGSHEVQKIISLSDQYEADAILQFAASIQQHSEHHIAAGIMRALKDKKLELWKSNDFNYTQGVGVSGNVNGNKVIAAGPNYFNLHKLGMPSIPSEIDQEVETVTFVIINDQPAGVITMADSIRASSAEAVRKLKTMNIKSFLLTGDNEKVAAAVAKKLGMDGYLANVLPHQKQEKIKEFQDKGEIVAMTGDGVNDAPALAQADVGIAVGSGTDVAAETADVILVNSDPLDVVNMIAFGRATYRKMIENLLWAGGYNIIAIPLAAGVLYKSGFLLSPAMGAVLMSLSTIIVAINAQMLRLKLK